MESLGKTQNGPIPPQALPQPSSYYRQARWYAFAPYDYLVTAATSPSNAPEVSKEAKTSTYWLDYLKRAAITNLSKQQQSSCSVIVNYGEQTPLHVAFISDFIFPKTGAAYSFPSQEELEDQRQRLVAIPVVVKTTYNHLVLFFIDLENNRIEFYDPEGLTIKDRDQQTLLSYPQWNLEGFYCWLFSFYGNGKTTLWENSRKQQSGFTHCGDYVLDYCDRRIKGETAEEITTNGKSYFEMLQQRTDKITSLFEAFKATK